MLTELIRRILELCLSGSLFSGISSLTVQLLFDAPSPLCMYFNGHSLVLQCLVLYMSRIYSCFLRRIVPLAVIWLLSKAEHGFVIYFEYKASMIG